MKVITRFAPSPTGFLHIGGARTALFNYLFSKHHNGKFLLRIEDTDTKRSTPEAIDAIINSLAWLELDWDGDIVFQSKNIDNHRTAAYTLLEQGKAYYCYCPPRENNANNSSCCQCDNLQQEPLTDVRPAIRLKINRDVTTSCIEDLVLGPVSTPTEDISDFIILRGDGTPTYLLASVIDDITMGITHVIRGNDHLINTFKQQEIYVALNQPLPQYAHIPLIHGPDGSKLSKRHGALGIEEYKNMGYLSSALINYLMKLGWSLDNKDIIPLEEAIKRFNIRDVQKSAARFDFKKLDSINAHYIQRLTPEQLMPLLEPFIIQLTTGHLLLPNANDNLLQLMPFLQTRFKNLNDIAAQGIFIMIKNIELTSEAAAVLQTHRAMLQEQYQILERTDNFHRDTLHQAIKDFATTQNMNLGTSVAPLRASLCGTTLSPASVFDIMSILGKQETLYRISRVMDNYL